MPPVAMVKSIPELLLSGFMAVLQPGFVLMSVAHVVTKVHKDV